MSKRPAVIGFTCTCLSIMHSPVCICRNHRRDTIRQEQCSWWSWRRRGLMKRENRAGRFEALVIKDAVGFCMRLDLTYRTLCRTDASMLTYFSDFLSITSNSDQIKAPALDATFPSVVCNKFQKSTWFSCARVAPRTRY